MSNDEQQSADSNPEEKFPRQEGEQSRIEDLEEQVRELSGLVEVLLERPIPYPEPEVESDAMENLGQLEITDEVFDLVGGVREGVERILGVQQGESLETRLGSIWLPRGAVLLFMTLLVLGIRDDSFPPLYKVFTGYGVSTCFVAYGLYQRNQPGLFSNALMGTGLSTLYFTTYALFFIPETQLLETDLSALPIIPTMIGVGLLVGGFLLRSRSETTTGITLALMLYTVVISLNQAGGEIEMQYALFTCSLIAIISTILQFNHRLILPMWITLLGTYGIYNYFFVFTTPEISVPLEQFYGYCVALLTLVYLCVCVGCIAHLRSASPQHRSAALLVGIAFPWFFMLTWYPLQDFLPQWIMPFRISITFCFILLTAAAQRYGSKSGLIMQMFLCQMIVFGTLALDSALTREWLTIAMGVECLTLAILYKRLPLTILKTAQLFLLLAIFVGSMSILALESHIEVSGYMLPTKWVTTLAAVSLFTLIAWYYDHRVAPHASTLFYQEDHWFLANRRWNWSPSVMAVMNTTVGALILTALTIFDLGESPSLPFILAGEGLAFALIGILLRTPQMGLSSVLMVVSAHVTYHFFWYTGRVDFDSQPYFINLTIVLALVSFLGSYFWERYLRRIEDGTPWEHDLLSAIPFIAATLVLTTLCERMDGTLLAPAAQVGLGLVLMAAGTFSLLMGLRIAAMTATLLGCGSLYLRSLDVLAPNTDYPDFLVYLIAIMVMIALTERLLAWWEYRAASESLPIIWLHRFMVAAAMAIGMLGLWHDAPQERLSLRLMALGVITMIFGVVFRSSQYRFAALIVIFVVIARLYVYDLSNLTPVLKLSVVAIITVITLIISWGYSRLRAKPSKSEQT